MGDIYCTNCNKEFEEFEDVTVVHGGVVEPFLASDYHHVAADDGPNYQTLCKDCALKLVLQVEQKPNRVVIELRDFGVAAIRAERPGELIVTVLDYDTPLAFTAEGLPYPAEVWGEDGDQIIGKLNTVEAEETLPEGGI